MGTAWWGGRSDPPPPPPYQVVEPHPAAIGFQGFPCSPWGGGLANLGGGGPRFRFPKRILHQAWVFMDQTTPPWGTRADPPMRPASASLHVVPRPLVTRRSCPTGQLEPRPPVPLGNCSQRTWTRDPGSRRGLPAPKVAALRNNWAWLDAARDDWSCSSSFHDAGHLFLLIVKHFPPFAKLGFDAFQMLKL